MVNEQNRALRGYRLAHWSRQKGALRGGFDAGLTYSGYRQDVGRDPPAATSSTNPHRMPTSGVPGCFQVDQRTLTSGMPFSVPLLGAVDGRFAWAGTVGSRLRDVDRWLGFSSLISPQRRVKHDTSTGVGWRSVANSSEALNLPVNLFAHSSPPFDAQRWSASSVTSFDSPLTPRSA